MKKRWALAVLTAALALACPAWAAQPEQAHQLSVTTTSDQGNMSRIRDGSYSTTVSFPAGAQLTLTAEEPIAGVYIQWAKRPSPWQLQAEGQEKIWGGEGFLHEYAALDVPSTQVTLVLPEGGEMCDIYAWSAGELPGTVQVWQPSCERADFLVLSTHADDEILFLGGVLAEYAGQRRLDVQVIYFSDYTGSSSVIREHEKLDGLWSIGVRHYPENGGFPDVYADNLTAAERTFDYEKTLGWVVEMIRKYRPQVCVAQDTNGEYGHGTHMLTSKAMQEGVTVSADPDRFPASAQEYGSYDVPKTYIHLLKDNPISLDCRQPLDAFGGRTALEVAIEAYKQHVSQQWCWFYVSDTNKYSISSFGLCRSTVGEDTENDMMEHLISYQEQERLEQERLEQERLEQERLERERLERERQEQERLERERAEQERLERERQEQQRLQAEAEELARQQEQQERVTLMTAIAVSAALFCIGVGMLVWMLRRGKKR